jgi:hypothetical protein
MSMPIIRHTRDERCAGTATAQDWSRACFLRRDAAFFLIFFLALYSLAQAQPRCSAVRFEGTITPPTLNSSSPLWLRAIRWFLCIRTLDDVILQDLEYNADL